MRFPDGRTWQDSGASAEPSSDSRPLSRSNRTTAFMTSKLRAQDSGGHRPLVGPGWHLGAAVRPPAPAAREIRPTTALRVGSYVPIGGVCPRRFSNLRDETRPI